MAATLIYLTLEQVRNLIHPIGDARDRLLMRLLYETGCTPSEVVNIRAEDAAGNRIKIAGEAARSARISGSLAKEISVYAQGSRLSRNSFLLRTRQSRRMSEKRARQIIQRYAREFSGAKINPIIFRYLHIAHAYENGVSLEDIADQLGLSALRVFQIIQRLRAAPRQSRYGDFLKRIG